MQDNQQRTLRRLDKEVRLFMEELDPLRRDPDLKMHANAMYTQMATVRREMNKLTTSSQFNEHSLDPQHSLMLADWGMRVFAAKAALGPTLSKFDIHDRRMTRVAAQLNKELNLPIPPALVTCDSQGGYMTYMSMLFILTNHQEDQLMSAYPDIVHEQGHIILAQNTRTLLGDFPRKLQEYFSQEGSRKDAAPLSDFVTTNWPNWIREFVCDMIATYTLGESFGYQHINLVSKMPARSYIHADSHPADDARLRAISIVLRKMGKTNEADELDKMWADRMGVTRERKGKDYDRSCPDAMLELLADRVIAGCRQMKIQGCDTPAQKGGVVEAIQESWNVANTNPLGYDKWEEQTLERLWQLVGLGPSASSPSSPRTPRVIDGGLSDQIAARQPRFIARRLLRPYRRTLQDVEHGLAATLRRMHISVAPQHSVELLGRKPALPVTSKQEAGIGL